MARAQLRNGAPDQVLNQVFDAAGRLTQQSYSPWTTASTGSVSMIEEGIDLATGPASATRSFLWNGQGRLSSVQVDDGSGPVPIAAQVTGIVLIAHGADGAVAGVTTLQTGEIQQPLTELLLTAGAEQILPDEYDRYAGVIGAGTDLLFGLGIGRMGSAAGRAAGIVDDVGRAVRLQGEQRRLVELLDARARQPAGFGDEGAPVILDVNLQKRGVVEALRSRGYDIRSVQEIFGRSDVSDAEILSLAERIDARVLTQSRGRDLVGGFFDRAVTVDARATGVQSLDRLLGAQKLLPTR